MTNNEGCVFIHVVILCWKNYNLLKIVILAGADIKEMEGQNFSDVWYKNFLGHWNSIESCKKPIIAAVNGYAVSKDFNTQCLKFILPNQLPSFTTL